MLNNSNIRIVAALVFSIGAHAAFMSLDLQRASMPVAGMPRQRVTVQLMARLVPVAQSAHAPVKLEQKEQPIQSALPLQRPVEVAIREIPAISVPTSPVVPELRDEVIDDMAAKPEPDVAGAESAMPAMIMARPLYRDNPPPEYPARARRRHLQGTVVLEVFVSKDGKVEQLQINASSGHTIFDRAALQAVRTWLFEPGQQGGRRVAMRVLVPVRFSLR